MDKRRTFRYSMVSPMPTRHRMIIGVDLGTTYSGISFVTTDKSSVEDINVIRSWPGRDGEWKVPTRLAYAAENARTGLKENAWGYQVDPTMISCSWTKLLLDRSASDTSFDDPNLERAIDAGMLRLPEGKTAQQVCSDFLREVYTFTAARLNRQAGKEILDSTPVDCWLTVPAVWSDAAQNATKAAARAAGFGRRLGDTINVISEPEAAAIAALKEYMLPGSLNRPKKGEDILICDCGGGTVDISVYTIVEVEPRLEFEELCGDGGKCGSTYIDRNLHSLMHRRFGQAFQEIDMRRKGPGSRFMNAWEGIKRSFGTSGENWPKWVGPLNMRGVRGSEFYDDEDNLVRLTQEDVESLFEPVVNQIIRLLVDQTRQAYKEGHTIDRLVLIGGFGDSEYLYNRLKTWCTSNGGIQLLCPEHPQAAIVRGAALRGLEGTAPRKKRCRRHYGVSTLAHFREGIDSEDRAVISTWDGSKRCRGRMNWLIEKGEGIVTDTKRTLHLFVPATRNDELSATCHLFTCSLEHAPAYDDHPRVERIGSIRTDFSKVDKSKVPHKREFKVFGKKMWYLEFDVEVQFGAQTGVLEFKTLIGDSVSGTTSLTFE